VIDSGSPLAPLGELLPTSGTLRHNVGHFPEMGQVAHCAASCAIFMIWHVVWQPWSARSYGHRNETRARASHTMPPSVKRCHSSSHCAAYHETRETARIVTIRHNPSPIDSPVFRWTIGGLARGAKERETLGPWREALRSARRWIFSARCYLARDARKPVRDAVECQALHL
jgi:hypothetical protein